MLTMSCFIGVVFMLAVLPVLLNKLDKTTAHHLLLVCTIILNAVLLIAAVVTPNIAPAAMSWLPLAVLAISFGSLGRYLYINRHTPGMSWA